MSREVKKGYTAKEWQQRINELPSKVQYIYYHHLSQYVSGIVGLGITQYNDARESHPEYWNEEGLFDPFFESRK